jgi:hypothetical protein
MYAVFSKVSFPEGQLDAAKKVLDEQLAPATKALPGFVDATWFGDSRSGHGLMVFDSEEHARAMQTMDVPPDSPQKLEFVEVYEVHGRA